MKLKEIRHEMLRQKIERWLDIVREDINFIPKRKYSPRFYQYGMESMNCANIHKIEDLRILSELDGNSNFKFTFISDIFSFRYQTVIEIKK